jgi:hypothetical protein
VQVQVREVGLGLGGRGRAQTLVVPEKAGVGMGRRLKWRSFQCPEVPWARSRVCVGLGCLHAPK